MRPARLRTIAVLVTGLVLVGVLSRWLQPSSFYSFPGITGPTAPTRLVSPPRVRVSDFDRGSDHRLAVLVTDPESGWLGLARGLKAHGIPFTLTTDTSRALRHRAVLVYPVISGRALSGAQLDALRAHVRKGGSILAFDLEGGGLQDLFGASSASLTRRPELLTWAAPRPAPEERRLRVNRAGSEATMAVAAYTAAGAEVLARYDDGSAAVTCRGAPGRACLMGVDLGALSERAMNGRAEPIARAYVNRYEPGLDELYRWVSDFYVRAEPTPWLVAPVPDGRRFSIVLSHDIDFTRSVQYSEAYADMLKEKKLTGTFFMQTKYIRDYNDDVFMNKANLPALRRLLAEGMEVGSHTVAHSVVFKAFPVGTGAERYPSYRPFVVSRNQAVGGTVFGEARVSKFLLMRLTGAQITSFRAGHLSFPFHLPDVLAAEGYRYDSSITADTCLTHLPFQLTEGREDERLEPVYEFPVTLEDEELPHLGARVASADDLIGKIARRGGAVVVLIHPDVKGEKLAFERRLIDRWRGDAWIGPLNRFGDWWRARDGVESDVVATGRGFELQTSGSNPIRGLTVIFPKGVPGRTGAGPRAVTLDLPTGAARRAL